MLVPKILPDDHDAMIELFLRRAQGQIAITGVIHVGAHLGQEVARYREFGIRSMTLIEANPNHCTSLHTRFVADPSIKVIHCAITDYDGTIELHLNKSRSGNDESSSILRLKELSRIVPTLRTEETITVPARRLDSLLDDGAFAGCNFLNMDIQGAELQALRGAVKTLQAIDAVLIETNLIEMYSGCALQHDIDEMLQSHGFTCIERVYHELYEAERRFPAWGESLFIRNSPNKAS
jgi:FkbM family methyltransferase